MVTSFSTYLSAISRGVDSLNKKEYGFLILRLGLSFLFLWFGITQLVSPESFYGYVPPWMYQHHLTMMGPFHVPFVHQMVSNPSPFVIMNGIFETILGICLLLGLFTRLAAFLLAVHLFFIALSLGYNDVAVRDLALFFATVSLVIMGPDRFSLERKLYHSDAIHDTVQRINKRG